jgi:hypothetical protein
VQGPGFNPKEKEKEREKEIHIRTELYAIDLAYKGVA